MTIEPFSGRDKEPPSSSLRDKETFSSSLGSEEETFSSSLDATEVVGFDLF